MKAFFNLIKNNLIISGFLFIAITLTVVLLLSEQAKRELKLIKTDPPEGTIYSNIPYGSFYFYFSDDIDAKTVHISSIPQADFLFEKGKNGENYFLKIYPKKSLILNQTYNIVVDKKLSSLKGARLKNDILYSFLFSFPQGYENQGIQSGEGIIMR